MLRELLGVTVQTLLPVELEVEGLYCHAQKGTLARLVAANGISTKAPYYAEILCPKQLAGHRIPLWEGEFDLVLPELSLTIPAWMGTARIAYDSDNLAAMCRGMINSGALRAYNPANHAWVKRIDRTNGVAQILYENGDTDAVFADRHYDGDCLDLVPVVRGAAQV